MENKFCSHCGVALKENADFCHSCGKSVAHGNTGESCYQYSYHYEYPVNRKHLPLSCILAYVPGLFWIPLLTDWKNPRNRDCANQGLWLTLTYVLSGMILVFGGQALYENIAKIVDVFLSWDVASWQEKIRSLLMSQILLALVLYSPVNGICGFFHGMSSDKPYILPVFGYIPLIRIRKNT